MRTVVIGIGNELCADDSVGLAVVRRMAAEGLAAEGVEVVEAGCPGLGLLDLMEGYDRAILVDAVVSGAPPGTIHQFSLRDLPDRRLLPLSLHGVNAVDALALAQQVEPELLPPEVLILGIEIADRTPFREGLTPGVSASIGLMIERIRELLNP